MPLGIVRLAQKSNFDGFEKPFAMKASLNLWLSEPKKVLAEFCRTSAVKTRLERR
jgi:hypothetical protein